MDSQHLEHLALSILLERGIDHSMIHFDKFSKCALSKNQKLASLLLHN